MAEVEVMTKQDLDALWAKMKDWFVKAPISAVTANTVAVFDGTTGKVIKSSGVVLGTAASRDVGAVTSGNVGLVTGDAVNTAINAALTAAMKIEGETTTAISDGSTTNPVTIGGESVSAYKGMVVFYGKKEFVWVGTSWKELGDEGSFALKTTTVTGTGYLTGGGALSANQTIDIASSVKTKIDNGAAAYGWGNHANAGYALAANLGTASTHAHGDYVTAITYDSTNRKLQQSKGGGTATDIVQFGSNAFNNTAYLPLSGGTMANTNVVTNLNADLLDGHHYSEINDAIGVLTNSVGQVSSIAQDNASNITLLDDRASDLESYFTNGVANSAAKLSTVSKTLFGNTYWTSGGVPTSIGTSSSPAALDYVTNIDSIAYFDRTNSRLSIGTSSFSYKFHVAGDIYAQGGWLRTSGSNGSANGWQSQDYGGGWYCDDYTYVKTYGNRSIYTAANILAGGNIVGTKGVASQGIANLSVAALSGSNFVTQVKIGSTAYNPSDGIVSLPAYPTVPTALSSFTNDVGYITGISSANVTTALGYTPAKRQASTETITGAIYDAASKVEVYDIWTPSGTTATFKLPYDCVYDVVNYVLIVNTLSSDITVSFTPQVGTAHIIAPNNSLVVPAGKAIEVSYLTQLIGSTETVVLSWSSAFSQYTIQ